MVRIARYLALTVFLAATSLISHAGSPADLAQFGRMKVWLDKEREVELAPDAAPWTMAPVEGLSRTFHFGVEWDEPRQFREVRAVLEPALPPAAVRLEYWVHHWPPQEGQGGWTRTDSPHNGGWRPIRKSVAMEGEELVFTFEPLDAQENRNAVNRPNFRPHYRQALKLRIVVEADSQPRLRRFRVLGFSSWAERNIWITSGCEGRSPNDFSISIYNGRIVEQSGKGASLKIRTAYLEHPPDSADRSVLTLQGGDFGFGVGLDDLIRERMIYLRDAGMLISADESSANCQHYLGSGRLRPGADIHSRVAAAPEQSLERALGQVPRLTMTQRNWRQPNRYVAAGFMGNRQKYAVEFNGNVFISKRGSKLFAEERARMLWDGDLIQYRIGTGAVPDFREREGAAQQSMLEDRLPVILTRWRQDGIEYHAEAFATLADAPLDPWKNRGDEPSVLMMKLEARNASAAPREAVVWLSVSPEERLRLRGGWLEAVANEKETYPAPRLRAVLTPRLGQPSAVSLPSESERQGGAACWRVTLRPGAAAALEIRIPFMTPVADDEVRRLTAARYEAARGHVTTWWTEILGRGMRLHVPDDPFNRFHDAALQHILLSVYRDVPTGLFMAPCGTYDYNMYLNETMMLVRLLDMRGLHDLARQFLEPALALQGSKPFPGRFRETGAILHGVRVDADHDYTGTGYNLNHGWTLWTASEHYLFTRDRQWFGAKLPGLRRAAEWIVSERQATMRKGDSGALVWEYGLLPPGQLEDNAEWHFWFAVNAWAHKGLIAFSRALEEIDPALSRHFAQEAASYREDIRRAVFRSMAASPAAPLRDGSWVPVIPSRTRLHGRDHGWIRNILYGAHSLIDGEVIVPDEPAASWILKDLEDNLFMAPMSFSTAENDWFSRGGMTLQPNLVNTPVTYLLRGEIPHALRALYNVYAVSIHPDVHAFAEWVPSYGAGGGPSYKTSDEACFLAWLRLFLLREHSATLEIASGAPRRWFRHGERIELAGAATFFGQASFRIESHARAGFIDAVVDLPAEFRARQVSLRLRHPEGRKIVRAERNSEPWAGFDPEGERVTLPAEPGETRVRVWF
jgi:hypothetical protein